MGIFDFLTELVKSKKDDKDEKVIVKNYIGGNNIKNNNNNSNNNKNNNNIQKNNNQIINNKISSRNQAITLKKIRLYCTGAKGKVFTTEIPKLLTHNIGIEVVIKNNTSQIQNVKLGCCIYDESGNNTVFNRTFWPKVKPYTKLTENIFVDATAFSKMKKGKYKSQFWINDKKVKKIFFTVKEK